MRHSLAEAEEIVARVLMANRTSGPNARSVACALVAAEADGLAGHGMSRVPSYAAQARSGKVDGFARPAAHRAAPGVVAIDAAHGFAFPALDLAVAELPPVARAMGVAMATIGRSHHAGAIGRVVEQLAEAGLVALMVANTPAAMAPWGGRRALFGTNPIAFAAPRPGAAPVVVDLSLSLVARGHVLAAKARGDTIPPGWALDATGAPTTDPDGALAGTMLPAGGAKGTSLALMVEVLAAGLTGANFAFEASSFLDDRGGPPATGQMIIAISPGEGVASRIAYLLDEVEGEPGARLPGSRRMLARAAAASGGIEVPDFTALDG